MTKYGGLIFALFFIAIPTITSAQTEATFRIDMRPQIKDSTFIPGEHTVELSGNQLPFSNIRTIEMNDTAPIDSIYTATIHFPSPTNDKVLKYNFLIKTTDEKITERRPRLLPLRRQKQTLPIVLFNSFSQ